MTAVPWRSVAALACPDGGGKIPESASFHFRKVNAEPASGSPSDPPSKVRIDVVPPDSGDSGTAAVNATD